MDRRLSGALAWGALVLLIGIPSSELLFKDSDRPQISAVQIGTQPWAEPTEWPNGKSTAHVGADDFNVPLPEVETVESIDEKAAAAESVASETDSISETQIAEQPRRVRAVDTHAEYLETREGGAEPPLGHTFLAGVGNPSGNVLHQENIDMATQLDNSNSSNGTALEAKVATQPIPFPLPVESRPDSIVSAALFAPKAPVEDPFVSDVRESIANIERSRNSRLPIAVVDNGGRFFADDYNDGSDVMLEPFDTGQFNEPRNERRPVNPRRVHNSWRATSQNGEFWGPRDGYDQRERLPAVRDGGVRLDLLQ